MLVRAFTPGRDIAVFPLGDFCTRENMPLHADDDIEVDWSGAGFVSPAQAAAAAALQLHATARGFDFSIRDPRPKLLPYLQRIDYYKAVGRPREEKFTRHEAGDRFIPLTLVPIDELKADPNGVCANLKNMITNHIGMSQSVSDSLDLSLGEIVDNVVQHSASISPGVVCAQYYPASAYVEICVADCGIGIPRSMGNNPKYAGKSDRDLLDMAFERGTGEWFGNSVLGTSKASGGMGLSFATALVQAVEGHIWAVTREAAIHIFARGREPLDGLHYPGTLVVMRIPATFGEVTEKQIRGAGRDEPALWNPVDGAYCPSDEDGLW